MALISVTEYSKRIGKDPSNIRRMLASSRLEGVRIGNSWAIDEHTVYPADRRVRSGNYRGWRRRIGIFDNHSLARSVNSMIRDLSEIFGNNLLRVVLYGSYARKSHSEESDIDIALFLKKPPTKEMSKKMISCVAAYELKTGKTLSVVDILEQRFLDWKDVLPFYKNIDTEGIVLWTNG